MTANIKWSKFSSEKLKAKIEFQSGVQSSLCDWFILNETCQRHLHRCHREFENLTEIENIIDNLLMENI